VQTLPSSTQVVVAGWKQLSAASLQVWAHIGPPMHAPPLQLSAERAVHHLRRLRFHG
jgi:hypothetical protein